MRPDQAFLENSDPIRLPVRSSVYADLWLGLSDRVRWNLTGNAQWQGPFEAQNVGTKFEFHVINQKGNNLHLSLGGYFRLSSKWDAVSPYVGARINDLDLGFSYDINVSQFDIATGGRGGPERSEEHTSELQSRGHLVCRLLLEKKKNHTSVNSHCGED